MAEPSGPRKTQAVPLPPGQYRAQTTTAIGIAASTIQDPIAQRATTVATRRFNRRDGDRPGRVGSGIAMGWFMRVPLVVAANR